MSSSGDTWPYERAIQWASVMERELAPVCERITIVGSLRRERAVVGDVELLCVSRPAGEDLFGEPVGCGVTQRVHRARDAGRIRVENDGPRLKRFRLLLPSGETPRVEVRMIDARGWAAGLATNTGPGELSRKLVTTQEHGGLLPNGWLVADGWRVWRQADGAERVFETEAEFLAFCGVFSRSATVKGEPKACPPEERDAWWLTWQHQRRAS